jgi:glycosyltransferase involved in cell wall biosynthesis
MGGGLIASLAATMLGKKFIVRVTGEYAWEQGQTRFGVRDTLDEFQYRRYGLPVEIIRMLEHWLVRRAHAVIAPSEYLKKIIIHWGVHPENISVIYNAEPHDFSSIASMSRDEAREKLNMPIGSSILVSAGRLVPWKGFLELIRLMPHISLRHPSVRLYIIGSGPDEALLKAEVARLKLEGLVIFTGRLLPEEAALHIRAADLFVLNTSYEGFSHQLVETLAMGTAIITTAVGGNPEIINNGGNGALVPHGDTEALKEIVLEMIQNKEKRSAFADEGTKTAGQFTVSRMIQEVRGLIMKKA